MLIDFLLHISCLPNILQNYCQVSLNENDSAIELSEANFENGLSWVELKKLVAEVMCWRAAETAIPANSRLDYKKH